MDNKQTEVVIFCPLPPKPNGIADYLAEQLPYFCREIKVNVVVENSHPTPVGIPLSVSIVRLEQYLWGKEKFSKIPHIYHVGNNPDTTYMLPVLLSRPGLVVIHDLNLHYLIDLTNLSKGDKDGYTLALFNNYGEAGARLGSQLKKFGWKGQFMPHELMMNASIVNAAERIIVHSEYSANKIRALGHTNVKVVPHHLSPAVRQYQTKLKMRYRGEQGIPGDKFVITSLGFIAKAKQIKAVLTALMELKQKGYDFVYILAGQCKPHEYDVYQDIADSGLQENVLITGFLEEDQFFKHLVASDLIINLRYPSGGETSGTLTRAMGMGLCCIVVDIGPFSELPNDCAVKLVWNSDFAEALQESIKQLMDNPQKRTMIGLNAKKWTAANQNINLTTTAYMEETLLLREHTSPKGEIQEYRFIKYLKQEDILRWQEETENVHNIHDRYWWKVNLFPINNDSVALVSEHFERTSFVLSNLYNYATDQLTKIEFNDIDYSKKINNLYSSAVVEVSLSLLAEDPVKWLAGLNKLIALSGVVVISLVLDDTKNSDISLTRKHIEEYMSAAGFTIEKVIPGPLDIDMSMPNDKLEEEWVFKLIKRSWMVNLNPPSYENGMSELLWLYSGLSDQSE
ncbi:glycosyltransferase family 4 protein [Glaciecola sp. 1036]|uniref:glycosyltransferase family 4 protein n=1 Tax=Alteromonadaceae TaxID=72275 RepID=UPI003D00F310